MSAAATEPTPAPSLVLSLTCPACGSELIWRSSSPPEPSPPTLQVTAQLDCRPCDRRFQVIASLVEVLGFSPAGEVAAAAERRRDRLRSAAAFAAVSPLG